MKSLKLTIWKRDTRNNFKESNNDTNSSFKHKNSLCDLNTHVKTAYNLGITKKRVKIIQQVPNSEKFVRIRLRRSIN